MMALLTWLAVPYAGFTPECGAAISFISKKFL